MRFVTPRVQAPCETLVIGTIFTLQCPRFVRQHGTFRQALAADWTMSDGVLGSVAQKV